MTDPIPERIAAVIVTRLEAITVTNGYAFNVAGVIRPDRQARSYTPKNNLLLLEQGDSVPAPELDIPGNPPAIAEILTFQIYGINRVGDRAATARSVGDNTLEACIKKAIVAGTTAWYHFTSLALNAAFGVTQPFASQSGDHAGIMVPLIVTYRYSELDPYTVRR